VNRHHLAATTRGKRQSLGSGAGWGTKTGVVEDMALVETRRYLYLYVIGLTSGRQA